MSRALAALPLLLSLTACNLEMLDDPFRQGSGRIFGTVTFQGEPVEGARANWVGQSSSQPPAITGPRGTFQLTGVPAGEPEIIIRSEVHNAALRTPITVVAGHATELKPAALQATPPLKAQLLDPELPIQDATVRLQEIPGLEASTKFFRDAYLTAVPRQGCYTVSVSHEYFGFPDTTVCPQDSDTRIALHAESRLRFQVHNAYKILAAVQKPITSCTDGCTIPTDAVWPWPNAPCVWPTRPLAEDHEDFLGWHTTARELSRLERFNNGSYAEIMACPGKQLLDWECKNSCSPVASPSAVSAIWELAGSSTTRFEKKCDETPRIPTTEQSLQDLESCLGMELGPIGTGSLYVLVEFGITVERPRLVLAVQDDARWHLYNSAELPAEPSVDLDPSGADRYFSWTLYKLTFPSGTVPSPEDIDIRLSWIIPK